MCRRGQRRLHHRSEIIQYACGAGLNQQWELRSLGTGYVQLVARHSGLCLDVSDAATADSARALASLDRLAATGAGTVLMGHGEPWTDGAAPLAREAAAAGAA
jgi:hypothetical protein